MGRHCQQHCVFSACDSRSQLQAFVGCTGYCQCYLTSVGTGLRLILITDPARTTLERSSQERALRALGKLCPSAERLAQAVFPGSWASYFMLDQTGPSGRGSSAEPSAQFARARSLFQDCLRLPAEDLEGMRDIHHSGSLSCFYVCCALKVSWPLNLQQRVAGLSNANHHSWLLT